VTTPQQRSLLLLKLAQRIEDHAEAFARLESLNTGKPYAPCRRRRDAGDYRYLPLLRRSGALCAGPGRR
jgi:acyl-CoA reductase-like NAD-dependent aldehyde dehydrogenase